MNIFMCMVSIKKEGGRMDKKIKISEMEKTMKKYFWFLPDKLVVKLCDVIRFQLLIR